MTPRIEKIVANIPHCRVIADVGCDHGYISFLALEQGRCSFSVLTDISEKCLDKARKLLFGRENQVKFYCTDGLSGVTEHIDCAVIAGMGGMEIIKIFEKANAESFLLQPMRNTDEVRKALLRNGYKIVSDRCFFDREVYYDLIYAKKGQDNLTREEIVFGRDNVNEKNSDFLSYVKNKSSVMRSYLPSLVGEEKEKAEFYIKTAEELLK